MDKAKFSAHFLCDHLFSAIDRPPGDKLRVFQCSAGYTSHSTPSMKGEKINTLFTYYMLGNLPPLPYWILYPQNTRKIWFCSSFDKWGSKTQNKLFKVTQPKCGRRGIWTQICLTPSFTKYSETLSDFRYDTDQISRDPWFWRIPSREGVTGSRSFSL